MNKTFKTSFYLRLAQVLLVLAYLTSPLHAAMMSARVRQVPDEIQQGVFEEPEKYISALVKSLTSGLSGDEAKTRVLHDWICDNIAYDTDLFKKDFKMPEQNYVNVLKRKRGICAGYSNLMAKMCSLAGVQCEVVSGWSKGFGYEGRVIYTGTNHAWNKVKIGGSWKLVDVTFDAGAVAYKTFLREYSTDYYMLAPEKFIYSHLPKDEADQLLPTASIRSQPDFEREPFIPGRFWRMGLSFQGQMPDYTTFIKGETSFTINNPSSNIKLIPSFHKVDERKEIQNMIWHQPSAKSVKLIVDVPDTLKYEVRLVAIDTNKEGFLVKWDKNLFESQVLPTMQKLLEEEKITQKEYDYFTSAYFPVEENRAYYLYEDLFAKERNDAIRKLTKLFAGNQTIYDGAEVLTFEVMAEAAYWGCGAGKTKFPTPTTAYSSGTSTQLISPLTGNVAPNTQQVFSLKSGEYTRAGISVDGGETIEMQKDPKTGNFMIGLELESDAKTVTVSAAKKNDRYWQPMWTYNVKQETVKSAKPEMTPGDIAIYYANKGNEILSNLIAREALNNYNRAEPYMLKSKGKKTDDYILLSFKKGVCFELMEDYKKALSFYDEAIKYGEESKLYKNLFDAYGNAGGLLDRLDDGTRKNDDKISDYYEKAIVLYESGKKKTDNKNELFRVNEMYRTLAIHYFNAKDYEKAYSYAGNSLAFSITLDGDDSLVTAYDYRLKGISLYMKAETLDDLQQAKKYVEKALSTYQTKLSADSPAAKETERYLGYINNFISKQKTD